MRVVELARSNLRCSGAVAVAVGVAVVRVRVSPVVVRPQVMPNLVRVRKIWQAVRVYHGVAVLLEPRRGALHRVPGGVGERAGGRGNT